MSVNCSAMGWPKQREECIGLFGVIHFVAYEITSTRVVPGLIALINFTSGYEMTSVWSQQIQTPSAQSIQFIPVECRPEEASSRNQKNGR